jgi:hypothetical protein
MPGALLAGRTSVFRGDDYAVCELFEGVPVGVQPDHGADEDPRLLDRQHMGVGRSSGQGFRPESLSPKSSLAEVCARLGLDLEQVRTLAGQTTLYLI